MWLYSGDLALMSEIGISSENGWRLLGINSMTFPIDTVCIVPISNIAVEFLFNS